jgi:integrase
MSQVAPWLDHFSSCSLGIPDSLKLYCARHTFGTVAMAETRNPGLVKDVMGHESLDTTMGYLRPETSQIKVVIGRLNQPNCT